MKKPNKDDYIDMRVYAIAVSAYIDHIESVNTDLLEALKDITLSGVELPINKCTKALRAIEKATK